MMGFREIRSEDFDAHSMQKQRFRVAWSPQPPKFSPPAVTHRSYNIIVFPDPVSISLCKSQNCLRVPPRTPSLAGVSGRSPEECCSLEVKYIGFLKSQTFLRGYAPGHRTHLSSGGSGAQPPEKIAVLR